MPTAKRKPTKPPAVVTIGASDLRRLFTRTIPFAGTDPYLPALYGVHLLVREGKLIIEATDRYTMARTWCDTVNESGPAFDALVQLADAKILAKALRPTRATRGLPPREVRLTVVDGELTVKFTDHVRPTMTWTFEHVDGQTVDMAKILSANTKGEPAPLAGTSWNPTYMARFAAVPDDGEPVRAWMHTDATGGYKPIIIECGTDFIGAIMPVRVEGEQRVVMPDAPAPEAEAAA